MGTASRHAHVHLARPAELCRPVPMPVVAGEQDPFFGAGAPVIAEAKAAGMGNVEWLFDGMRRAIEKQKDSPHTFLLLEKTGHVSTAKKDGHRVHDEGDKIIRRAISSRKPYPFERDE